MRAIYLIARREFLSYVATWGFWLSLASLPLFMGLGFGLPLLIENSQPTRYFVMVDQTGGELEQAYLSGLAQNREDQSEQIREAVTDLVGDSPQIQAALENQPGITDDGRYVRVYPEDTELEQLRPYLLGDQLLDTAEGPQPLFSAVYLNKSTSGEIEIDYWSVNLTDSGLRLDIKNALQDYMRLDRLRAEGVPVELIETINALSPTVRELNPERSDETAEITAVDRIPFFVSVGFALALWMVVFSVANMLLTAMIEEKGNKILEMMLASSRHHEILMGKLLGVAMVSATLLLAWGSLAIGSGVLVQQVAAAADMPIAEILSAVLDPGLLLPAAGYFLVGYLTYGAIFLAIGSLCETIHDAQTLMTPIMLIMMVPLFIITTAFDSPDSAVVEIASWVPVWTPFIMLARLPLDPSMTELIGTTSVMVVTALLVLFGSGSVFRLGALNHANQDTVKAWFKIGGNKKKPE